MVGKHFNYYVYRKHLTEEKEKKEKEFMCAALVLHINMHKVCNCHVGQCVRLVEEGGTCFVFSIVSCMWVKGQKLCNITLW